MRCLLLEYVTLVDGYVDILKLKRIGGIYKHFPHGKIRPNRTNEPLMCRMDYPNIGYSHGNPMICHGLPYLNGQRFGYNPFCANHLIYLVLLQIRLDYVRLDQVPSGLTHPPFPLRVGAQTWAMTLLRGTRFRHWQCGVRIKPLVVPKKIDYIIYIYIWQPESILYNWNIYRQLHVTTTQWHWYWT